MESEFKAGVHRTMHGCLRCTCFVDAGMDGDSRRMYSVIRRYKDPSTDSPEKYRTLESDHFTRHNKQIELVHRSC
jgi:hypothetical protein